MLLEKNNSDNGFVLKLVVFSRVNLLKKISSLAAILTHEACSITDKEFPAFITKFSRCDVSVMIVFVEFSEDFFESACDQVIDSDIVGCKEKYRVSTRKNPKIKN